MSAPATFSLEERTGLPRDLRRALERFARSDWERHLHYGGLAAFWRSVHGQLKAEARGLEALMQAFREGSHDAPTFALGFGAAMRRHVSHLHMHHNVEDRLYFPKFRSLDAKLGAGLDLLEADHEVIHRRLLETVDSANRLLGAIEAGDDPRRSADLHAECAEHLLRLLDRHLDDEEEIVIPVMLEHGIEA